MSQSYQQTTQQSTQQSTQQTTQQAAPAVDPVGNQQQVEEAGLAAGQDDRDYGLAGTFAGLLLDVMPLPLALSAAREFITNSAVRDWVLEQDPAEALAAAPDIARELLDTLWPEGTGVAIHHELSLGGNLSAVNEGSLELTRSGADTLSAEVDSHPGVDLSVGGGAEISGAFGEMLAGAAASTGLSAVAQIDASLQLPLDPAALLDAASDIDMSMFAGAMEGRAPDGKLEDPTLALQLGDDVEWDVDTHLQFSRSVQGEIALTALPALDLSAVNDAIGAFAPMLAFAESGHLSLGWVVGRGLTWELSADHEIMANVMDALDELGQGPSSTAREVLTNPMHDASRLILRGGTGMEGGPTVERVLSGAAMGADVSDSLFFSSLDDYTSFLEQRGGTVGDVLSVSPALERSFELSLDPAGLEQAFPGWLVSLVGLGPEHGFIASRSTLAMTATARVEPEALAPLADVRLPQAMSAPDAVAQVQHAVLASRFGAGRLDPWLGPHQAEVQAAAQQLPQPADTRLQGSLSVGAGAGGAVSDAAEIDASGALDASLVLDRALDPAQVTELSRVMVAPNVHAL